MRNYLVNERKISPQISKKFNLGYALKSWDALSQTLLDNGFSEEILIKADWPRGTKMENYLMYLGID